ncbi:GNAT family N-acetyltransferase [Aurantivibrio plasticivorans]
MNASECNIQAVGWQDASEALRDIREKVFIHEQRVPFYLEWDGLDPNAIHFLVRDSNQSPVGCSRLLSDGQVGRVAVLERLRRQGIGHALMQFVIRYAEEHAYPDLFLHSQVSAQAFYEALGFVAYGDVYEEAGIQHISMKRTDSTVGQKV